jgi:NADPH-dependent 2,4-dienoyl-CoA reductase/sulfur reductase-like enzyme
VDASLRTSDPDIFAAGDVANAFHPTIGERIRSEHWANALNQGPAAARAMLGQDVSYDEIPYAYSDQFEIGMEFSGYLPLIADATLVYRGNCDRREFIAFWMLGGRIVAGMNVNVWDVNEDVQGVIRRGNIVDVAALADPDVPLKSL